MSLRTTEPRIPAVVRLIPDHRTDESSGWIRRMLSLKVSLSARTAPRAADVDTRAIALFNGAA